MAEEIASLSTDLSSTRRLPAWLLSLVGLIMFVFLSIMDSSGRWDVAPAVWVFTATLVFGIETVGLVAPMIFPTKTS